MFLTFRFCSWLPLCAWLTCLVYSTLAVPIDVSLICVSTSALDVVIFLLENYVAHAGTTLSTPGAGWYDTMLWKVVVVFVPFASLRYSMELIKGRIICGNETEIHTALSREALLVVARSQSWKPRRRGDGADGTLGAGGPDLGDEVFVKPSKDLNTCPQTQDLPSATLKIAPCRQIDKKHRAIHGRMELPEGYCWSELKNVDKSRLNNEENSQFKISSSHSWLQTAVSIAQLLFSSVTLYRTRGTQINRYGFAAYGLSVFPYTLMSLVNLVGTMILGEYPFMYVLKTDVLVEASKREGARFDGYAGYLSPAVQRADRGQSQDHAYIPAVLSMEESPSEKNDILVVTIKGSGERRFKLQLESATHSADYVFEIQSWTNETFPPLPTMNITIELLDILELIWEHVKSFAQIWTHFCRGHPQVKGEKRNSSHTDGSASTQRSLMGILKPLLQDRLAILAFLFDAVLLTAVTLLPYVFIYAMTGFRRQNSTPTQRGWLMAWICVGQFFGATVVRLNRTAFSQASTPLKMFFLLVPLVSIVSSVGGYVQVISMYLESGSCSLPPS